MGDAASETLSLFLAISVVATALIGGAGPALLAAILGLTGWLFSGQFHLPEQHASKQARLPS